MINVNNDNIILELDIDDVSYKEKYPLNEYHMYFCAYSRDGRKLVHLARKGYKGDLLYHYYDDNEKMYFEREWIPFNPKNPPIIDFKTIEGKPVEGSYKIVGIDKEDK